MNAFSLCRKVDEKLYVLVKLLNLISSQQRRILMKLFFEAEYGYCPLLRMFHHIYEDHYVVSINITMDYSKIYLRRTILCLSRLENLEGNILKKNLSNTDIFFIRTLKY